MWIDEEIVKEEKRFLTLQENRKQLINQIQQLDLELIKCNTKIQTLKETQIKLIEEDKIVAEEIKEKDIIIN